MKYDHIWFVKCIHPERQGQLCHVEWVGSGWTTLKVTFRDGKSIVARKNCVRRAKEQLV